MNFIPLIRTLYLVRLIFLEKPFSLALFLRDMDEQVYHYLCLFNQLNNLYPFLYTEWAGFKTELGGACQKLLTQAPN